MNLQERTISIEVTVPDPAWTVSIQEVYRTTDRLLVVSQLDRDPGAIAVQVISKTSDTIRLPAPDLPVDHYVLGKTFGWANEPHHFIRERAELDEKLKEAELLYRRGE